MTGTPTPASQGSPPNPEQNQLEVGVQQRVAPAISGSTLPQNVQLGGGLTTPTQPMEMAYPLRRDTFELLCETETMNEDKRWRDIALAFFGAAVAGFLGLLGSVDWKATITNNTWTPIVFTFLLGVLAVSSFAVFMIQHIKVEKKPVATGYWRVKAKITTWYEEHQA